MKNILILLFSVGACSLQAQPYIPMLGQTNEWRVVSCDFGCITDAYYTSGDTVVNGIEYLVLDGYHYIQGNFLIREDVQERKVYLKLLGGHALLDEFPLYDFSIEDGDTVNVYNPISPLPENGGKFVLDSVVVRTLETQDHRFFYLHAVNPVAYLSQNTVWVEGVGSRRLINTPGAAATEANHLACAFKDGVLQYSDTDSVFSCGPLHVSDVRGASAMLIYPNPTNGNVYLQLKGGSTQAQKVEVYDMLGRPMVEVRNKMEIDLSALKQGLYVITVTSETQSFRGIVKRQ